jgi:hypothetical protein
MVQLTCDCSAKSSQCFLKTLHDVCHVHNNDFLTQADSFRSSDTSS